MNPISIRYSLYLLAFTIAWIMMEHYLGFNSTNMQQGQYTRFVPMILFWVLIFYVVFLERKNLNGTMNYRQGFRTGIQFSIIYCLGFTLIIAFYQHFVNPGFYDSLKAFTLEQLHARNASQKEIDDSLAELEFSFNGSALSYLLLFVFSMIWGVGLSAIAALTFKRK